MNLAAQLQQRKNNPEIDTLLAALQTHHTRRLWNDMGISLLNLVYTHRTYNSQQLLSFVFADLATKLDPMVFLELIDLHQTRENQPLQSRLTVFAKAAETLKKDEVAVVYLELIKAKHMIMCDDVAGAMGLLKTTEASLMQLRNFPKLLYSVLNFVKADYYWRKDDLENYHATILQYLVYTERDRLSEEERAVISERAVLSALVSDKVLSFGDILESDFIAVLKECKEKQPLWTLVEIFNRGKVAEFVDFTRNNKQTLSGFEFIVKHMDDLERKIRVIALYDAIFFSENSFSKQEISFREVSGICGVDELAVERLLIHVLSIELVKGYIDEPRSVLVVKELKPRELDRERLGQLKEKFVNWRGNIEQTMKGLEIN